MSAPHRDGRANGTGGPARVRLEETLGAYHDGELGGFARWRLERRLRRSPELRRELAALDGLSNLVRESEPRASGPDLWDGIEQRLPAVEVREAAGERAAASTGLGPLGSFLRPLGAVAAVAGLALALGWWATPSPSGGGGVIRWMDSGGRSVLVLEDDAATQTTIIWLLDGVSDGASRGGRREAA